MWDPDAGSHSGKLRTLVKLVFGVLILLALSDKNNASNNGTCIHSLCQSTIRIIRLLLYSMG